MYCPSNGDVSPWTGLDWTGMAMILSDYSRHTENSNCLPKAAIKTSTWVTSREVSILSRDVDSSLSKYIYTGRHCLE